MSFSVVGTDPMTQEETIIHNRVTRVVQKMRGKRNENVTREMRQDHLALPFFLKIKIEKSLKKKPEGVILYII
jgi:hypothetical protein